MVKVFLSWSGERSKLVATALSKLLPDILQDVDTWMSAHDIRAGAQWSAELSRELDESRFGIICLTPENLLQPWLLYEAGCIAKGVSQSLVVPYRFGLTADEVPFPLAQFQGVDADETGTERLVQAINSVRDNPIKKERLARVFSRWWPDLDSELRHVPEEVPEEPQRKLSAQGPTVRWHSRWRLSGKEYREALELSATAAGEVHGRRITVSDGKQKEFQVKGHRRGRYTWLEYHREEGRGGGAIVLDEYTPGRLSGVVVAPNCDTGKLRVYQNRWVPEVEQMSYCSEWQRKIDEIEPCSAG